MSSYQFISITEVCLASVFTTNGKIIFGVNAIS